MADSAGLALQIALATLCPSGASGLDAAQRGVYDSLVENEIAWVEGAAFGE
jgi:hypothetical protein